MDPNLFHIDWARTFEALMGIVVLSFLVERACAILLQSRWWISRFEDERVGRRPGEGENTGHQTDEQPKRQRSLLGRDYPMKEALGFAVALVVCWVWDFDAVSIVLLSERTQFIGIIVTAAVVAGGSKASVALFRDLLPFASSAAKELQTLKEFDRDSRLAGVRK